MKMPLFLSIFFFLIFSASHAYGFSVSGHVLDPDGDPIEGTSVTLSGLTVNVAYGKSYNLTVSSGWDYDEGGDPLKVFTDGSLCCGGARPPNAHGWKNHDYHQPASASMEIDLAGTYHITKIRYHPGERNIFGTWTADTCSTPLGTMSPQSTSPRGWSEVNGSITASSIQVTCSKTKVTWNTDWMFIGEIEVYTDSGEAIDATDSNGHYSISGIEDGTYALSASKEGYADCSANPVSIAVAGADVIAGFCLQSNVAPVAHIDSISSSPAVEGEEVTFSGHGTDSDGSVVAYNWMSSIDGFLSVEANFSTSSLSVGNHTIYFKVQDDDGAWSEEVSEGLEVVCPTLSLQSVDITNNYQVYGTSVEDLLKDFPDFRYIWNDITATLNTDACIEEVNARFETAGVISEEFTKPMSRIYDAVYVNDDIRVYYSWLSIAKLVC